MTNMDSLTRLIYFLSSLTVLVARPACSEVVGAFVLPHGGIALDPTHFKTPDPEAMQEAWQLHTACQTVGQQIQQLKPDLILLSTPHGVADLKKFLFYLNDAASGTADTDNCDCPPCCYDITVALDNNTAISIEQQLQGEGLNVSGLTAFGGLGSGEAFPLRWGEVIPLHFAAPISSQTKVIIFSMPTRRFKEEVTMIPELLELGDHLFVIMDQLQQRVVVIVSGDLAHTHNPNGPYGYSNASEPFDLACGRWVETQKGELLIEDAADYVDRALSCGFTGLVTLQGMLQYSQRTWRSELLANFHPSYYGMMVASFIPSTTGDVCYESACQDN